MRSLLWSQQIGKLATYTRNLKNFTEQHFEYVLLIYSVLVLYQHTFALPGNLVTVSELKYLHQKHRLLVPNWKAPAAIAVD